MNNEQGEKADNTLKARLEALEQENRDLRERLRRWQHGGNALGTNHLVKRLRARIAELEGDPPVGGVGAPTMNDAPELPVTTSDDAEVIQEHLAACYQCRHPIYPGDDATCAFSAAGATCA